MHNKVNQEDGGKYASQQFLKETGTSQKGIQNLKVELNYNLTQEGEKKIISNTDNVKNISDVGKEHSIVTSPKPSEEISLNEKKAIDGNKDLPPTRKSSNPKSSREIALKRHGSTKSLPKCIVKQISLKQEEISEEISLNEKNALDGCKDLPPKRIFSVPKEDSEIDLKRHGFNSDKPESLDKHLRRDSTLSTYYSDLKSFWVNIEASRSIIQSSKSGFSSYYFDIILHIIR